MITISDMLEKYQGAFIAPHMLYIMGILYDTDEYLIVADSFGRSDNKATLCKCKVRYSVKYDDHYIIHCNKRFYLCNSIRRF